MLVYEDPRPGYSVAIWVKGDFKRGYTIVRQVLTFSGEDETTWMLTPTQSSQLRASLGDHVCSDTLKACAESDDNFDFLLTQALETLAPALQPFTWISDD